MSDRSNVISKLIKYRPSRESYIRAKLNVLIPSQIKGLRLNRPMTQIELASAADMKQSRISAMERPGQVQFNIDTLIRLAAAFKVGLKVEFVSFGEMLQWENDFSQDAFNPTAIESDESFLNPIPSIDEAAIVYGKHANIGAINIVTKDLSGAVMTNALVAPGTAKVIYNNSIYGLEGFSKWQTAQIQPQLGLKSKQLFLQKDYVPFIPTMLPSEQANTTSALFLES